MLSFFFFPLLSNFFLLFVFILINNAYPLQGNVITEQSPTSIKLLKEKKETVEQPLSLDLRKVLKPVKLYETRHPTRIPKKVFISTALGILQPF